MILREEAGTRLDAERRAGVLRPLRRPRPAGPVVVRRGPSRARRLVARSASVASVASVAKVAAVAALVGGAAVGSSTLGLPLVKGSGESDRRSSRRPPIARSAVRPAADGPARRCSTPSSAPAGHGARAPAPAARDRPRGATAGFRASAHRSRPEAPARPCRDRRGASLVGAGVRVGEGERGRRTRARAQANAGAAAGRRSGRLRRNAAAEKARRDDSEEVGAQEAKKARRARPEEARRPRPKKARRASPKKPKGKTGSKARSAARAKKPRRASPEKRTARAGRRDRAPLGGWAPPAGGPPGRGEVNSRAAHFPQGPPRARMPPDGLREHRREDPGEQPRRSSTRSPTAWRRSRSTIPRRATRSRPSCSAGCIAALRARARGGRGALRRAGLLARADVLLGGQPRRLRGRCGARPQALRRRALRGAVQADRLARQADDLRGPRARARGRARDRAGMRPDRGLRGRRASARPRSTSARSRS